MSDTWSTKSETLSDGTTKITTQYVEWISGNSSTEQVSTIITDVIYQDKDGNILKDYIEQSY